MSVFLIKYPVLYQSMDWGYITL